MDENFFIYSIILAVTISLIAYFYTISNLFRPKKESGRIVENKSKKFYQSLLEGLKTGSITTIDDLINIYKGISDLSSEDLSYRYGLSRRLRTFLVDLISKDIDKTIDDETIVKWKQQISEFIRINEEISPYADLPSVERNLLNDISAFLEKNDTESTKRKLLELAGMIQARNDDLNKIQSINKYAVPLSIIGLILSIIFGLMAIFK
jgi:hypothetical protein